MEKKFLDYNGLRQLKTHLEYTFARLQRFVDRGSGDDILVSNGDVVVCDRSTVADIRTTLTIVPSMNRSEIIPAFSCDIVLKLGLGSPKLDFSSFGPNVYLSDKAKNLNGSSTYIFHIIARDVRLNVNDLSITSTEAYITCDQLSK